jgi:hypothetical protein
MEGVQAIQFHTYEWINAIIKEFEAVQSLTFSPSDAFTLLMMQQKGFHQIQPLNLRLPR